MSKDVKKMIKTMVDVLVSKYKPEKIILFGSYADGNPDEDSDIDLLIVKNTSDRFLDRWSKVHEILTGTHPSIPLDTLIMTPTELSKRLQIGDQFISNIIQSGQVLYP